MNSTNTESTIGTGTLVVLLHAFAQNKERLAALCEATQKRWPDAKLLTPDLDLFLWSTVDPNEIVLKVLGEIDKKVEEARDADAPIQNIVLIGHSMGALLARKVYVVACGENRVAPFEKEFHLSKSPSANGLIQPRKWARSVSRLILFAGTNRGWRITHHLSLGKAALWWFGSAAAHLLHMVTEKTFVIATARQGAEFITQLRIQWIRMRQEHERKGDKSPGGALTIQLLGSRDDMVAPEDNIDLVSGGDFIYLDVPYSGHSDVIELNDSARGAGRRNVFEKALCKSKVELQKIAVLPSDDAFASPSKDVERVAFVIHGIRDSGHWTNKIARRIKQRQTAPNAAHWATETSSYGYFPMLPFIFPWYRRKKVEWLMDQYTEALARYPNATFSYVGHSNGTYLLAEALKLYPCCSFHNVVFAGSVVRRNYDWAKPLDSTPPRINAVLNFISTTDWVVAFFPKFFELIRIQDLGSAGHDGFDIVGKHPRVHQITYANGGHGAAIEEPLWDVIADFVHDGTINPGCVDRIATARSTWVAVLGRFPPIIWSGIAVLIWFGWWLTASIIASVVPPGSANFVTGFALAAYLLAIWLLATRI